MQPLTDRDRRELRAVQDAAAALNLRFRHAGAISDPQQRAAELRSIAHEARHRPARQRLPLDVVVAYNQLEQDARSRIAQEAAHADR